MVEVVELVVVDSLPLHQFLAHLEEVGKPGIVVVQPVVMVAVGSEDWEVGKTDTAVERWVVRLAAGFPAHWEVGISADAQLAVKQAVDIQSRSSLVQSVAAGTFVVV